MKKFYAILVSALLSVNLFADPTLADLQSFVEDGYYVACFQAPTHSTCNDIYWMGSYVDWAIATPLEDLVKCEPLAGQAGWYVAKVPVVEGKDNDGKPIQLNECGQLTWDVQPGPVDGKPTELVAGADVINPNGAEYDFKGWTKEPTIIKIGAWKNDYNPCEKTCAQQIYTIRIYPPFCEFLDELEPTIMGTFNQWGGALTMEFKGSFFEYVTPAVTDAFEFKFNNDANGSWDHQFQAYNAEDDEWTNIPAAGNLSLTNGTQYYEYDATNRILTFDFSDDELYRYAGCEEQVEEDPEYVVIWVNVPANGPAAVDIIGEFDSWAGTPMELLDNGWYFAGIQAEPSQKFKFREGGTWDNEIVYVQRISNEGTAVGLEDITFKDVWTEDSYKGTPCKSIELDYSDATVYCWKSNWVVPEGVEDIVLTAEAQKVVVDGVMYIVRDNKLFSVQGIQVK